MSKISRNLLTLRNRHFLLLDMASLAVMPSLALLLRLDGFAAIPGYALPLALYTTLTTLVCLPIFYRVGLYGRYWRYASIDELFQIVAAVAASGVVNVGLFFLIRSPWMSQFHDAPILGRYAFAVSGLPRSIPFIAHLLTLLFVGGSRFSVRLADRWLQPTSNGEGRRVVIMGAGDAGAMIARELQKNPHLGMTAIGFLDDDQGKNGVRIHGVPVLGGRDLIPYCVQKYRVEQVIIAMPAAGGKTIRNILSLCEQARVKTKIIPGVYELLDDTVSVKHLRDVAIEDLLRREPVHTDIAAVQALMVGKRVLVTGAGGSIGSELCRQVMRCQPAELVIVGHGENSIFAIFHELQNLARGGMPSSNGKQPEKSPQVSVRAAIADIRSADRLNSIFELYRPQIVFHAAAHKHVPLMEANPAEAVTNNILGTRYLLEAALAVGVERFVMISTDKAVNPTSIMGASKRVAELLVYQASLESGRPYVTVRFGNVLGSRGSVIVTFRQQIANGGPVTVTHPEMRRYFMTVSEAVQLVLQAATLGEGGEVFVLDMGEPVRIVDLAHDLIELSGLQVEKDIDIVFTGPRPGDKMSEQLFVSGEHQQRTRHHKIFIAGNSSQLVPDDLMRLMPKLEAAAGRDNKAEIVASLQTLVPEYRPEEPSWEPIGALPTHR